MSDAIAQARPTAAAGAAAIASVPPPTSPARPPRPAGDLYLRHWAGQFAVAALIVSQDGHLLWTNPAADAVLTAGRDFQDLNGFLVCVDKSQAAEFRAFLLGLGEAPAAWVYRRDDTAHQVVRAEPVRPEGLPPAAALMIYPIDAGAWFIWSDFQKVFGLTPTETAVVKRLIGGDGAEAIAEELSITLETVRTHVRRIYAKLGVNNREKLFSKISPFRIR